MRKPIDTLDETTPDLEAVGAELTTEAPRRVNTAPHYGGAARDGNQNCGVAGEEDHR
jgi:hypothetical protein